MTELTRSAYDCGYDFDDEWLGIAIRGRPSGSTVTGAAGFEGLDQAGSLAGRLATLAAVMVQRAHSFQKAREAAAATQLELLRSAILDAFAHPFKTPLAASLAAGDLRSVSSRQRGSAHFGDGTGAVRRQKNRSGAQRCVRSSGVQSFMPFSQDLLENWAACVESEAALTIAEMSLRRLRSAIQNHEISFPSQVPVFVC